MALTQEQILKYVKSEGNKCPYCGSDENESCSLGSETNGNWHQRPVRCNECGEEWNDLYLLAEILEDE